MRISIVVCLFALVALIWILRREQASIGLPIAYLANLLLLHVPGAVAQLFDRGQTLTPPEYTRTGIILTAVGTVAFVIGVVISRFRRVASEPQPAARTLFWKYCAYAGGICTIASHLINIPSIGAVITSGGPIWMLGVMLALQSTIVRYDRGNATRWFVVLAAYPVLQLLFGGFLSYGAMAVIIVMCGVMVVSRSPVRIAAWSLIFVLAGTSMFFSYFKHRPEIRAAVWAGGSTDARINATMAAIKDIKPFDPRDPAQLDAIDQRLNQNYFVGLAAARLKAGTVNYLHGRSLIEGFQALIPRALWPDKPVTSGSPLIVGEMTGLIFDPGTSFGVGNVMEFDINFGLEGVIVGFFLLGLIIGRLDLRAAERYAEGRLGGTFIYFLPAVALIQPNGSLVELMSGAASAAAAALAWRWTWEHWPKPVLVAGRVISSQHQPQVS